MEQIISRKTKEFKTKHMFLLSCGDAGRAFINGIIANFLLIFFIPDSSSTKHIDFLIAAALTLAIIKLVGVVWDAITDPFVANLTDKYNGRGGKRMHFMKLAFIPYALTAVLIFFPPIQSASWINIIWVALLLFAYYTFSTLYIIPHQALSAEVITDPQKRVKFYTIDSLLYVLSFAIVYLIFVVQSSLLKAGFSYEWSYRIPFIFFGVIGVIMLLIPILTIKEEDFVVNNKPCHSPLFKSLKETFKYKNFVILTIAFLVMWIGINFFNTTLVYYVKVLMGLQDGIWSTLVMGAAILLGIISYPLINYLSKRMGKCKLLVISCGIYVFTFLLIYFYKPILNVLPAPVLAFAVAILVSMPISVGNIIPNSCFADIAQYDYIKGKENRTGMFLASKNFCLKLSNAISGAVCSVVICIGSANLDVVTARGVQLTALIAAATSLIAFIIYMFYRDKEMIKTIKEYERKNNQISPYDLKIELKNKKAHKLYEARKDKEVEIREAAKYLGISTRRLIKIETGKTKPSKREKIALIAYYDLTYNFFDK